MGDVVPIPSAERDVVEVLEDALAEARKSPKKAVLVIMLEDRKEGWDVHSLRAGPLLTCLGLAIRLVHKIQQSIDES